MAFRHSIDSDTRLLQFADHGFVEKISQFFQIIKLGCLQYKTTSQSLSVNDKDR